MNSLILAAGTGTRLRPITIDIPKCLVKIGSKSLLDWQLENLKLAGKKPIYECPFFWVIIPSHFSTKNSVKIDSVVFVVFTWSINNSKSWFFVNYHFKLQE